MSQQKQSPFPIKFAVEALSELKKNFKCQFSDFDDIANDITIFPKSIQLRNRNFIARNSNGNN